jgi:transposase-like protein
MVTTLKEVLEIVKRLPEKDLAKAKAELEKIKEESEKAKKTEIPVCPDCKENNVVRNGKRRGKQNYICRSCKRSFVETTKTALFNSHSGEAVWKQVIRDTIEGISLDATAEALEMHHETVFNMRHKILRCIEQEQDLNPPQLTGVCEADETYILENYKGKKLPDDFWRKARKHGAVAQKPGLSNEYICVCAAVERGGKGTAAATGRSQPGGADIVRVLENKVTDDTLVLCDGAKSYGVLESDGICTVMSTSNNDGGFKNINDVNGFHSFIKERNRNARGFATKYLNRYNSLFSLTFRKSEFIVDDIYNLLTDMSNRYNTIAISQSQNLFNP